MPRILSTIYFTASVPLFIFANLEHELSSSKWRLDLLGTIYTQAFLQWQHNAHSLLTVGVHPELTSVRR